MGPSSAEAFIQEHGMHKTQILVLGGGPAGGAVAIGLARLGYPVTVVSEPRPFDAVEGISDRVLQGLQGAGFNLALEQMAQPSPRAAACGGYGSVAQQHRSIATYAESVQLSALSYRAESSSTRISASSR